MDRRLQSENKIALFLDWFPDFTPAMTFFFFSPLLLLYKRYIDKRELLFPCRVLKKA